MPWPERIVVDPEILAGKPLIRGTRVAVELVLELLAAGQSESEILANYPGLTREDILACLSYASYLAHEYKAYPTRPEREFWRTKTSLGQSSRVCANRITTFSGRGQIVHVSKIAL